VLRPQTKEVPILACAVDPLASDQISWCCVMDFGEREWRGVLEGLVRLKRKRLRR